MKVFNTLTGQKEEFSPQGDEIKMYVCGVTPYADSHIGHAMSYIIFDVIRRYLQFRGYKVRYVQNITDIDDKIISRANQLGISPSKLAEKYSNSFFEDMGALNIGQADIYPRATEEIPKIIEIIQGLIDKEHAYVAKGSVYFRVKSVPDYGKLSHRSLESMMAGARIEAGEEKEHPMDFVLWKASKPGEPSWASLWGGGRPGWHIECSAMSLKYLGDTLDIHGGGQDLVFPHHENEIAQSESFTGTKPFVKYWLHNGMVQFGAEKMSKSVGNLITIKEALAKYSPDAIRIFVLSSYYRSPLTYSEEALEAAEGGVERLLRVISRDDPTGGKGKALNGQTYRDQFTEAMDDDFNTPQALAVLFNLARAINQAGDSGLSFVAARSILSALARGVLGLELEPFEFIREPNKEIEPLVNWLVRARNSFREAKHWQPADEIRSKLSKLDIILEDSRGRTVSIWKRELKREVTSGDIEILRNLCNRIREQASELGIVLEDTPQGTVWKYKRS